MNCIHGIDARFCAACNSSRAGTSPSPTGQVLLDEILQFLNDEQIRATDRAVAEALGVGPRALGARLGLRRPEAAWIVSAETSLPTGCSPDEWHPALLGKPDVITSGTMLLLQMASWRRSNSGTG